MKYTYTFLIEGAVEVPSNGATPQQESKKLEAQLQRQVSISASMVGSIQKIAVKVVPSSGLVTARRVCQDGV